MSSTSASFGGAHAAAWLFFLPFLAAHFCLRFWRSALAWRSMNDWACESTLLRSDAYCPPSWYARRALARSEMAIVPCSPISGTPTPVARIETAGLGCGLAGCSGFFLASAPTAVARIAPSAISARARNILCTCLP